MNVMKTAATSECPVTKAAKLLSDTWTMLVMHELMSGTKRFCELARALIGISTRTLTLKLKKLEEDGLVLKTDEGAYVATPKGKGLRIIENAMRKYSERFL